MSAEAKVKIGEVEVNVKSVSGRYAMIVTTLTFVKAGKVVKECGVYDLSRFVRPESRPAILDAIKSTEAAVKSSDEHKAAAIREREIEGVCDHQDRMARVMALQG